jgi:hypothetical protein
MAQADMHGGRMPYDEGGALVGPARVLFAPTTVAVPTGLVIENVADVDGEYPPITGWLDFGLAADAPSYSHSRESEGITYQQPSGDLFQQISSVNRTLTVQVAHIDAKTLEIIENAGSASTVAAVPGSHAGYSKVNVGLYADTPVWRVALIAYRPSGAAEVVETDSGITRPPMVQRVIPRATIAADESATDFDRGTPVNFEVVFNALTEPSAPAGGEHGYWIVEDAGTIAAAA